MLRAIFYRILGAIPVLVLVAFGIFALLRLAPGDAASALAPEDASEADLQRLREQWGLDESLPVQFIHFLGNMIRLDFGISYRYNAPINGLIADRLPATLELAVIALLIATIVAVPLGIITALRKGSFADAFGSLLAVLGVSAPSFWVGILLVLLFSAHLNLLPSSGRLPLESPLAPGTGFFVIDSLIQGQFATLKQVIVQILLPALTLAFSMVGIITRITRSAVIDVGQEEFVTTAVAKGLNRQQIVRDHLLPNAAIPIVTIIGLELGVLISGSIIVEVVFSWPGLGSLLYQAVSVRDIPLTTGIVVTYTLLFILINIVVDLVYMLLDPRLRTGKTV